MIKRISINVHTVSVHKIYLKVCYNLKGCTYDTDKHKILKKINKNKNKKHKSTKLDFQIAQPTLTLDMGAFFLIFPLGLINLI